NRSSTPDYNTLEVEVFDGSGWLNLHTQNGPTLNNSWQLITVNLSGLSLPQETTFRFSITEDASEPYNNDILIDDFRIFEMPACPNTPSDLNLISSNASTITVDWTETGSSTNWEVEIVPQGTTPTGSGITTNNKPHTFDNLISSTVYDVYIKAICANGTSSWTMGTFSTSADYCGGDRFYDSGGVSGNYSNYENWQQTIYPAVANTSVRAIFHTFNLEFCCDYLRIYDGPSTSSNLIYNSTSRISPGTLESTHPSGALTFTFSSDSSVTGSGWDAEIICSTLSIENPAEAENMISYYPNPVNDLLHVNFGHGGKSTISVYSMSGQILNSKSVDQDQVELDFRLYETGVYLVRVELDSGAVRTFNVIKN
ncbi:MAG: T9SS type A sorting domain-containing protein, partial [Nonlabens sp.]